MKLIKNNKSEFVKLRDKYINDFPLLNIGEEHLWISGRFTYSDCTYVRPEGDSSIARLEVRLFNESQEIKFFWLEINYKYTENERIEDAALPSSFKIRPEAILGHITQITVDDIANKYSDVIIHNVKPVAKNTHIEIQFSVQSENDDNPVIQRIRVEVDNKKDKETLKDLSITGEIDVNVLKLINQEVKKGATLTIEDLKSYQISQSFLDSPPPITLKSNIVKPNKDVKIQKISYIPPISIDSRVGYLQVEYKILQRLFNERVAFEFASTIRQAAEAFVHSIPIENFKYIAHSRKVPPLKIKKQDFYYKGLADVEIHDVKFDKNLIDDNSRFTKVVLHIKYRTAIVPIPITLEFEISRNEYKNRVETDIKTENGSIIFDPKTVTPQLLFKAKNGNRKIIKDIIKKAEIVEGYPYNFIKELEVINFLPESRIAMFKVNTVEKNSGERIQHIFEKQYIMKETYYEYKLEKLTAKDIEVDNRYIQDYPPKVLHEKIFKPSEEYYIQWIQYIPPSKDTKQVDVKIKVSSGNKTKFIIKKLFFKWTISEHLMWLKYNQVLKNLQDIRPSDLSINIDFSGEPVEEITADNIIGVPPGIECNVIYKKPEIGKKSTRIIIKLKREDYNVGFEQTIIFNKPTIH
ncbi:MAG: hypothetical protein GY679_01000 [Mycoplasma sp.]|nr:hypothetical protein [Mycoplasma sp.]